MKMLTTVPKVHVLVVFFFTLFMATAQEKATMNLVKSKFQEFPRSIRRDVNFKKAFQHFLKKEHDSTLLYSHNFLTSRSSEDLYCNYCHYFRGVSFKGKDLFSEAQKEFKKLPKSFILYHSAKMKMATISLELGEYSLALRYLLEINELPEHELKKFERDIIYHDIGLCYLHLEKFEESENFLLKSLELQEVKNDTNLIISSYMDIANLYYVQYKDDQAIPFFEKAYSLSKLAGSFTVKQNAALNMAVVEENRENFIQSIQYRKEFEQWKDSLNDQNKIWEVAQLEKKFISEKNQAQIALLAKDNSIKRAQLNTFIYSSILLLLLVGTLLYFYLSKRRVNKLILAQKTELDALNDTKDRLFSVVSHDLRSNVDALDRSRSKLSEIVEGQNINELDLELQRNNDLTVGIKGLLDNMLNWALLQTEQMYFQQEDVSLAAIVNQTTHNYLPLSNSKNIRLETTIAKNVFAFVDIESLKIVLRNLLDNAIKFCNEGDQISIYTADSSDSKIKLIVEDTGAGMSQSTLNELLKKTQSKVGQINQERTGLGLHLCQAMISKNEGDLEIESEEGVGTKLIITLPLTQDYE